MKSIVSIALHFLALFLFWVFFQVLLCFILVGLAYALPQIEPRLPPGVTPRTTCGKYFLTEGH